MDKKKLRHELAELNEAIDDCYNAIHNNSINLLCDHKNKGWHLAQREKLLGMAAQYRQMHEEFMSKYADIINS